MTLLRFAVALFPSVAVAATPTGAVPIELTDLDPLGEMIGDARFVGLGESIHTSGGYYEAKFAIFRYLVEEHGFRVLAMETPWVEAEEATHYVATCEGDPIAATGSVFGVFADVSLAATFQWMCEWNRARPDDPVSFLGFDIQQGWDDARLLRAFLREHAPGDEAETAIAAFERCSGATSTAGMYYEEEENGPADSVRHAACHDGLDRAATILDAIAATEGEPTVAVARVHIRGLRAFEDSDEAVRVLGGYTPEVMEARDAGMADVLRGLVAHRYPDARVAVWAHNTHLALRGEDVLRPAHVAWRDMGSYAREHVGDDWFPIAFVGYDIGTSGGAFFAPPRPRAGSLERRLHDEGHALAAIDLRTSAIGGQAMWVGDAKVVPNEQFPVALYFEHSRPMLPARLYGFPPERVLRRRFEQADRWRVLVSATPDEAALVAEWVAEGFRVRGAWTAGPVDVGEGTLTAWYIAPGRVARIEAVSHEDVWEVVLWFETARADRAPEVAAAVGTPVVLTAWVRRDGGTWLVLGDGTRLRVAGDPWTWPWERVIDAPVDVRCTPTEPLVVADCDPPLLTSSPP